MSGYDISKKRGVSPIRRTPSGQGHGDATCRLFKGGVLDPLRTVRSAEVDGGRMRDLAIDDRLRIKWLLRSGLERPVFRSGNLCPVDCGEVERNIEYG